MDILFYKLNLIHYFGLIDYRIGMAAPWQVRRDQNA